MKKKKRTKNFIVKVQLSQFTTEPITQVLVYNKDKSYYWQGDATPELIYVIGEAPKSFWYAKYNKLKQIELLKLARWQDW